MGAGAFILLVFPMHGSCAIFVFFRGVRPRVVKMSQGKKRGSDEHV